MEEYTVKEDYIKPPPDENRRYLQKRKNFAIGLISALVLAGTGLILGFSAGPFLLAFLLVAAPLILIIYPIAANKTETKIYYGDISIKWIKRFSLRAFLIQVAIIYIPLLIGVSMFMSMPRSTLKESGLVFFWPIAIGLPAAFFTTAFFVFLPSYLKFRKYSLTDNKKGPKMLPLKLGIKK